MPKSPDQLVEQSGGWQLEEIRSSRKTVLPESLEDDRRERALEIEESVETRGREHSPKQDR
jgi:hypothetical protein